MKTPTFWNKKNILYYILLPLGWLYFFATTLRIKFKKPYKSCLPVICIGNLTAGGTGKTPVSIAIAQMLKKHGKNPFFISRGYGGKLKGVVANRKIHTPYDVGDEPLLLSEIAPVCIHFDRAKASIQAFDSGADMLIMDDGFQNPSLHKDISFLVFNGKFGIGNGGVIPSGPLRETFTSGIKRADALIVIGDDKTNLAKKTDLPVFFADITEDTPKITNTKVYAFAGIGYPEKLYQSLKNLGLSVVKTKDFPDHHFYSRNEIQSIIDEAKKENLTIFTTSKDYVKIPADLQEHINVLNIKIKWRDESVLETFLKNKLEI
ncbi:MAG: tetraacyldisaccharide 4'-kinase [Alphaproteobacteria bacterium]|nr:tetraacyldisaccharide 4'-kinase [Alphaproteobacteria bacterium]